MVNCKVDPATTHATRAAARSRQVLHSPSVVTPVYQVLVALLMLAGLTALQLYFVGSCGWTKTICHGGWVLQPEAP